jgi:transposase, IS5 family
LQSTLFPPEFGLDVRYVRFCSMPLGQLRLALPIKELAALLPKVKNQGGQTPWFDNEGKVALQFLKAYENCSDEKLRQRINTDWSLQFFCGISLGPNQEIKDKNLIWQIRKLVAGYLDIEKYQQLFIQHWKSDMDDTQTGLCDATCYESYVKYPTDVKLLWDCNEWVHKQIKIWSKKLGLVRPRNKYKDNQSRQQSYQKQKRKTHRQKRKQKRLLLALLNKQLLQLDQILAYGQYQIQEDTSLLELKVWSRYQTIAKIYEQQKYLYDNPGTQMGDRIVSLYKPYLHPIVRGKENKRVEFGAKVNSWQVGGLNFVEYMSFRNFHEGNRLKNGIVFHQKNLGSLCRLGADQLYATNANRSFCTRFNINTNFKAKGRPKSDVVIRKQESQMRALIGKLRSTVLEGTYGNDKNHYGLAKIKARNEKTEVAWIFFGMMTANGAKVAKKRSKKQRDQQRDKSPPLNLVAA